MNLKQALLDRLEPEQLKELCVELDVDADRRSGTRWLPRCRAPSGQSRKR